MDHPFLSYSKYLKSRYGHPIYRVGVDAGFSCPHRAKGGCSYCESHGARAVYLRNDENPSLIGRSLDERKQFIEKQIDGGLAFLRRRYEAEEYILYFQANTNTNAPISELKELYDHALSLGNFREFAVSTRPDCMDNEIVDLLSSYITDEREVWVELGLQSGNDKTLERIGRGHGVADFLQAYDRLSRVGIKIAVHLILGLPGEGIAELSRTLEIVSALKPDGVKFHNLHIPRGTELFEEYLRGEISSPSLDRHVELLVYSLERLPPETVIMRLSTDTPGGVPAPRRFGNKNILYQSLERALNAGNTFQGKLYSPA